MTHEICTSDHLFPYDRGPLSRKFFSQTVSGAGVFGLSVVVGAWILYARPTAAPSVDGVLAPQVAPAVMPMVMPVRASALAPRRAIASNIYVPLLDPTFSLGVTPVPFAQSAPLGAKFEARRRAPAAAIAEQQNVLPILVPVVAVAELVQDVPLPPLRPAELVLPPSHGPVRAFGRRLAQQNRTTVRPTTPANKSAFFERLFGTPQPSGPVLAYAAPEDGLFGNARRITSGPSLPYDQWTAVYDIAAHTVYMPNGTRLEAHSGLGSRLDDPRYVNERMRGATPPHVYELEPRAQLFHGVKALRLIPVGSGDIFGRTGLLAHTYMLGRNGDSNGCVSFRNYNAFLQAFLNGKIKRLAVVARLN